MTGRRTLIDAYLSAGDQLAASYGAALATAGLPSGDGLGSVLVCGMGGSAAAGDLVCAALGPVAAVPLLTIRAAELPGHAGPATLAVCVSYSGNTHETLAAHADAVRRKCRTLAVASGGTLAARAGSEGLPLVRLPADCPQPRAAMGHMAGGILGALEAADLVSAEDEVRDAVSAVGEVADALRGGDNEARRVAEWIGDRIPVVWGSTGVAWAAAWRWKCGFNENAEVPAFASALPELDHHEVVGWSKGRGQGFCAVILRHEREPADTGPRIEATLDAIADAGLDHLEVWGRGRTALAQGLSLMLVGDVASALHAAERGIDPEAVDAIDRVKAGLRDAR